MFFSFKIEKPIKKLFAFALVAFTSGALMSAITMRKEHCNHDSDSTDYYNELMNWIDKLYSRATVGTNKSLNGIKVFIRKEDVVHYKNIVKLYFYCEANKSWEEVVSEKIIKENILPLDIKEKLKYLKTGNTIEITDIIFN